MGIGGRGWLFPPQLPLLIDGPFDPGSTSSGTNSWAVFWGAVRAPRVSGCWGAVPCRASSPPPSCCGLTRALCLPALGRPAKFLLLKFCTRGATAWYVDNSFKEIVTWDPSLAGPLGGGERYRLASVMIFRRPVYESSDSSHVG